MLIKKVNHNTIDVFLDKGWYFWGRFKLVFGKQKIFQLKGISFQNKDIEKITKKVFE